MKYVQRNTGFRSFHDHPSTIKTVWMNGECPVIVQVFPGTAAFHLSRARFLLSELSETVWSKPAVRSPKARPTSLSQVDSHCCYPTERSTSHPAQLLRLTAHWEHILWRNQSIMWRADLRDTLRNLLMRQDFVSVMLLSCDLLSHSRSLTDETLSVTPLSEWSYIHRLVSKWLMDSTGHDGWDIKLCTVQRI